MRKRMKHWKKKESFNQQPKEKERIQRQREDEASKERAAATELRKKLRKKERKKERG
jgi:hypothetical protein